jgi:hypothetical protein
VPVSLKADSAAADRARVQAELEGELGQELAQLVYSRSRQLPTPESSVANSAASRARAPLSMRTVTSAPLVMVIFARHGQPSLQHLPLTGWRDVARRSRANAGRTDDAN